MYWLKFYILIQFNMSNETQSAVAWTQKTDEQSSVLSKIKWFFHKSKDEWWGQNSQRLTRAFHLTRKDSIVSVLVALVVVWWAVYYWKIVLDEYAEINSRANELKEFRSYNNIKPDSEKLSPYVEWNSLDTINWMIWISDNIEEELAIDEMFKQQQKSYYEVLLENIYLPSLNVWKDPYTKNFNMSVLWQRYLESDKFQSLYLIQYWSDFAKYVWNDADYNVIDKVKIWDKTVLKDNPEYFYVPITIKFSSPNKRSFLLFVNKLSTTSNQNNIALLNEFFFYLLRSIREGKSDIIDQLMQKYLEEFSSSSNREYGTDLSEMTEQELSIYRDKVIGYNLYHWIIGDLTWEDIGQLIDDNIIERAIKESALCTNGDLDQKCLYNFREKYRNLPYLAYKIWLENQRSRTSWLLEFLQDLPPALAITNFGFQKYSDLSFLDDKEEEYEWTVTFNAYWRYIMDPEIEEASVMLWKLCFWSSSDQVMSPDLALDRVDDAITSLWWNREYSNVQSLWELQTLFTDIKSSYNGMSNYDKMIKLFEIRRMMNDANLCNK